MTAEEILENIIRNRANKVVRAAPDTVISIDVVRKFDEIEWALQAIAEHLGDLEPKPGPPPKGIV